MNATKGFSLCRGGQEGGLQSVQGLQVFTDQAESVIPGHEVAYAVLTLPCPCRMGKNADLLGSGRCGSRPSTGHLCDAWVCLVQAFRHHMASRRPMFYCRMGQEGGLESGRHRSKACRQGTKGANHRLGSIRPVSEISSSEGHPVPCT